MNGPFLFAAPPSGFNGPAYHQQQGYPFAGAAQGGQDFAYNGDPQQAHSMGGGMMQMQMPPSFAPAPSPNNPYTSAPHTGSVPAQAPALAGTPQNSTPAAPQVASPPQRGSPNAVGQGSHISSSSHTPPTKYPMAAPPVPHTPQPNQAGATGQEGSPAVATPKSPTTPGSQQSREAARTALLLKINEELLEEVQRLYDAGKGGAISPQQALQFRNEGKADSMASDEYIQCLRRIQSNFAYLMPKAQNASGQPGNENKQPQYPGPTHMTPPSHMPEDMKQKYVELRELFPGWQGMDQRMPGQQGSSASPRPGQQPGANGFNAPGSTSTTPTA